MQLPDTIMTFKIKDSELEIPDIVGPNYVYKVGDKLTYSDILDEDAQEYEFKVTKVGHFLQQTYINTDQFVIIHLEKDESK
jgi:hypothetical protein